MTTFREFLADLIREYFAIPRTSQAAQEAAAKWQPQLPHNLEELPGYRPGQYIKRYHHSLERAIQAATTPDITKLVTLKPIHNPITPIPETITPQRESTPSPVDKSLILWPSVDDEDATEVVPAIRLRMHKPATTKDLPALEKLSWFLQAPISPHETGEQEKLPAKIEDGAFLL